MFVWLTKVSLPGLIAHTSMDQQSIQTLKDHIEGILKYSLLRLW
jgi:hypothetical protein